MGPKFSRTVTKQAYLPGEATATAPSPSWQRPHRALLDSWGLRLQASCSLWNPGWMMSEREKWDWAIGTSVQQQSWPTEEADMRTQAHAHAQILSIQRAVCYRACLSRHTWRKNHAFFICILEIRALLRTQQVPNNMCWMNESMNTTTMEIQSDAFTSKTPRTGLSVIIASQAPDPWTTNLFSAPLIPPFPWCHISEIIYYVAFESVFFH